MTGAETPFLPMNERINDDYEKKRKTGLEAGERVRGNNYAVALEYYYWFCINIPPSVTDNKRLMIRQNSTSRSSSSSSTSSNQPTNLTG